jgi:hypothetical protein
MRDRRTFSRVLLYGDMCVEVFETTRCRANIPVTEVYSPMVHGFLFEIHDLQLIMPSLTAKRKSTVPGDNFKFSSVDRIIHHIHSIDHCSKRGSLSAMGHHWQASTFTDYCAMGVTRRT